MSRWDCLALSTEVGDAGRAEAFRAFTTYKAQIVVLTQIGGPGGTSVFERMEPMALLALSCFCQRVYNASDPKARSTWRPSCRSASAHESDTSPLPALVRRSRRDSTSPSSSTSPGF